MDFGLLIGLNIRDITSSSNKVILGIFHYFLDKMMNQLIKKIIIRSIINENNY